MYNYFTDNAHCLKTEISHRISFVGNVAVNSPLWLVNVANNLVFNNTFINSTLSLMRNDRGVGTDKRASFDHNATGPGPKGYNGQKIANNVFVRCPPYTHGPFFGNRRPEHAGFRPHGSPAGPQSFCR
ncbi:MAG: hypothetical protein HC901_00065 [Bdellovibrionaceae bacterium]|nr:hypothetical protein [Pseudobdellovibrionaceae bacterium]